MEKRSLRQVLPLTVGSLLGVSFGTMMGWTSATFPLLTDTMISPIPITWNESPTIAAFLMEGAIVGTLISSVTFIGSKLGVFLSGICQIVGWIVMFFAEDMLTIAVSRMLIGFGHGFGSGQLRIYARETCEQKIFQISMKYIPLSINIGVIFTYTVGGFVTFRTLSLVCVAIPIVNVILFAIIPKHIYETPAVATIDQPGVKKSTKSGNQVTDLGWIQAIKDRNIRNELILLFFIIFIPQYTGFAANINYSQIVHIAALNTNPHLCSIIYSVIFLCSTLLSIEYSSSFRRKPLLVISCFITSVILCILSLNFYFLSDLIKISQIFTWSPLIFLCIFNMIHVVGINSIPTLLIIDKFPTNARIVASKFYFMYFFLSAIFSTKIFQVFFTNHGMYTSYVFFSSISFGCGILALLFFKESKPKRIEAIPMNGEGFHNEVDLNDEIPTSVN